MHIPLSLLWTDDCMAPAAAVSGSPAGSTDCTLLMMMYLMQCGNTTHTYHAPRSHQTLLSLGPVPTLKLLGIMFTHGCCRPTTFHTVTAGGVDGWCHKRPVWSVPHAPITPNFLSVRPVRIVKLLGVMFLHRCCRPTTFHTVTAGGVDGWCQKRPVWSTSHSRTPSSPLIRGLPPMSHISIINPKIMMLDFATKWHVLVMASEIGNECCIGVSRGFLNTPNKCCGLDAGSVGSFFWPSPFWSLGDFFWFFLLNLGSTAPNYPRRPPMRSSKAPPNQKNRGQVLPTPSEPSLRAWQVQHSSGVFRHFRVSPWNSTYGCHSSCGKPRVQTWLSKWKGAGFPLGYGYKIRVNGLCFWAQDWILRVWGVLILWVGSGFSFATPIMGVNS